MQGLSPVKIALSASLILMTRYLRKRGNVYQFSLRVPTDLLHRYPSQEIRKSLRTSDPQRAARLADREYEKYQAEFERLRTDREMTPVEFQSRVQEVIKEVGSLEYGDDYFRDQLHAWMKRNGFQHEAECERLPEYQNHEYLDAVDREALRRMRQGDQKGHRLSDALRMYRQTHKNAGNERRMERPVRDWGTLVAMTGDILVKELTRSHARAWMDAELKRGLKTTSVDRAKNNIVAILNVAIRELEIPDIRNPFASLRIPNHKADAEKRKTPSVQVLREVLAKFGKDDSPVSLIIRMQLGTGTRIAEVSQLATADVVLDAEVPYLDIRFRQWGTLKNDNHSPRKVPLVGCALEAARVAVKLAGKSVALFPAYAKERGNDNSSAAANKRLQAWGFTSHGFRHAMKDLLRESNCTEDIQEEIMGHSANKTGKNYGQGFSLSKKAERLVAALVPVTSVKEPAVPREDAVDRGEHAVA
jgi:integrase